MEHSALHALELIGLVIALGGVFLILGLVQPAQRALGPDSRNDALARALSASAGRWVFRGALMAALATLLNLFVQVAEVRAKTVFNGVNLGLVAQFATQTTVGRLSLARVVTLILMAVVSRRPGKAKWWFSGLLGLGAVVLTGSVSHAAAQPVGRLAIMASQMAHVLSAAVWIGVLIQLLVVRPRIEGPEGESGIALVAEIVRRFSPIALLVTSMLGLSGLLMIFRLLADTGAVLTSAYGLTLIVKLTLLLPAIFAGYVNFRIIRPQLAEARSAAGGPPPRRSGLLKHFGKMLELEVTAGVLVIIAAGILASVSPPGEAGAYRLTLAQQHVMLHPRIPSMAVVNPATFYGAETRGLDDLRYSEFTHHWSGIMVCLLGLGWLLQSAGGGVGKWAGHGWPLLLVPFAVFVALAADPEVWFLRRVSLWQAIGDPQLLEHQLGAAMILILVWLGWRDHGKPAGNRPLGYALPVILVLGGILLLGHAHSTLTITEDVTNLINVQHAVFGAFILFAGATRWLALRGLVARPVANIVWPAMIIGLGLFMALFYRETI
jgi:putative copper resistance protein D